MWRDKLEKFAKKLQHPAWGYIHSKRVLDLSIKLAKEQNYDIDLDSITAASFLHDIGAFPDYRVNNTDHSDRSIQLIDEILPKYNFPSDKIPIVKEIIEGHMFYREPSSNIESIIFHDADVLDFMGFIGIARLLSIVGLDDWTPDLQSAIKLIDQFSKELPNKLHSPLAKKIGESRRIEMISFLTGLSEETNDLKLL
ncbi:MAG: HD domain-containing protein [Candidatus Hermodarchaeota archaeon]